MANTGSCIPASFTGKSGVPPFFHSFLESRFLFKRLINEKANQIKDVDRPFGWLIFGIYARDKAIAQNK